ncbi:MAG TPA: sigma-70 family RNA polymerase sigma factor [Candidatus Solibacter sp.]|nr:sigma-70 family RNA polymerase sigma factor [Candidatus Solibacter sp.]
MSLPPFQTLVDEHKAEVYRLALSAVGPDDADDCFQETLLAALRAYPTLRHADNLRGWLLTIAHRKALDHHRARGRGAVPAGDMADIAHLNGAAVLPPDVTDAEIWASVRRLPPKQSLAVAHRFVNDLAYREIGRLLECTEEAARRSVHEGLKKLREEYAR